MPSIKKSSQVDITEMIDNQIKSNKLADFKLEIVSSQIPTSARDPQALNPAYATSKSQSSQKIELSKSGSSPNIFTLRSGSLQV